MDIKDITVKFAEPEEAKYAELIVKLIYESAFSVAQALPSGHPNTLPGKSTAARAWWRFTATVS